MIQLDTEKLDRINQKHGLTQAEIKSKASLLPEYLEKIHARKQGFYDILDDKETIEKINDFASKVKGKYQDIIVLGIGGSALGTICLQQSLKHLFENELKNSSCAKLHVLDNIDPTLISQIDDIIDYEKTLFIVVSKSGTTPETASQYNYFRNKCDRENLDPKEHFVFITDPKKGVLHEISEKEKIPAFDIPENVGGRFSVLTAVGLLPAKLIEIDIERLINGAKVGREAFLSKNFEENIAFQLATTQYLLSKKHKYITVLMPYSQRLIKLADWYRQLLAESIGKKLDNEGKEVFAGLTPINALGVTDQHSQSQLYNEGPNDKLIVFIELEKFECETADFNKLINIEKQATEKSLIQNHRPVVTIKIDAVNEESLGELFMLFEASIAFLGEYYNINAFDQPGVELSKKLTKELLQQ